MDKYEDLGLEASKFLEDLNMYEASRDGLFRTRRDAGNNSDFEETRRVFASKMTKIHMQKHQEEMAKNNQAIKLNGGHNSGYYTKDRPPINSLRQPGEAAAKPPILSGPVSGTATGSQYVPPLEVHKHHPGVQPELPAGRIYGYGNSYDNKEPHAYQHNTPTPPPSPGNASPSGHTTHGRHPASPPPAAWAPGRETQLLSGTESLSHRLPVPPTVNSLPSPSTSSPATRSPPSSTGSSRSWTEEPCRPDPIPALPLSAFTGGADFQQKPASSQPPAHYAPPSPTLRSSPSHNGPPSASPVHPEPAELPHQPKAQAASTVLSHASISKASAQQGQSPISSCKQVEADVPSSLKASHLPGLTQLAEQGPSPAEVKLEALTQRLEKEMDAQPKADYFGKTL